MFEVQLTSIDGVVAVTPGIHQDDRGSFVRRYCASAIRAAGIEFGTVVQVNHSRSRHGTIRGLHVCATLRESRIVAVTQGAVFDVVADLRPWSPTFLKSEQFTLSDANQTEVIVPPGCAHGFQALSEQADVSYLVDAEYDPELDACVRWDDPDLAIPWPLEGAALSDRDRTAPLLAEIRDELARWFGFFTPRS